MKTHRTVGLGAVLVSLVAAVVVVAAGPGEPTTTMPYHGFLELNGVAVEDVVSMRVELFTAASGGSPVFSEEHASVDPSEGRFSLVVGSVSSLADSLMSNNSLYVALAVQGADDADFIPLAGRQRLHAAPYAVRAENADLALNAISATNATTATAAAKLTGPVVPAYAAWDSQGTGGGGAAIYNDNAGYGALMVVGNNSATGGIRRVKMYDDVDVTGGLSVGSTMNVMKRPVAVALATTHTAATDGFISAFANGQVANPCQLLMTVDTPNSAPITHLGYSANAHLTLPVPAGSTYRIEKRSGDCSDGNQFHFWPLGAGLAP